MLYLSGSANVEAQHMMHQGLIGFFTQPDIGNVVPKGIAWAADNGCYSPAKFTFYRWYNWLEKQRKDALFACVPDVILDHEATLERWKQCVFGVQSLGFKAAFCAQDGCTEPPSDADVLFLGGSTAWKISPDAHRLTQKALALGMPVHMGRVNSYKRLRIAHSWGCSTVDGTFLAFAPATNADRLMRWLQKLENDTARDIVQLPGCCSAGHPLEGENLLIAKNGDRRCRTCNRTRWRK